MDTTSALRPNQRPSSTTRRALLCGLAAVLTTGVLAACGDDKRDKLAEQLIDQAETDQTSDGSATGASSPVPDLDADGENPSIDVTVPDVVSGSNDGAPSDAPVETPAPIEKRQIDKTVWWGGFKITVGSAEGSSNALSSTINVSVAFENLTAEVANLDRNDIVLTVGTQSYLAGLGQTPDVPPNARNDAILDFLVDDTFVIDDAVLTFGSPDVNQAVLPFGAGPATSFEPRQLALDATAETPIETIHFSGGTIDASYASGEKGTYIVRLPLQATYTGGGAGGDLILPNQFALKSPAGSSVVGLPIAPGDVVAEAVYTGQDLTGKAIAFKVTALDPGTWTVSYTDSAGMAASAEFTVA